MLRKMLDRPVTVTMAMLVVMVLGVVSIRMLPVSLIPDIDIPYITVQVTAPELSAVEIEETVARPLRQQLVQMQALEDIRSECRDGSGTVKLTFRQGTDIDYHFIEVNERIDRTMGQLRDIDRPRVFKSSAADIPAFYINMTLRDTLAYSNGRESRLFPVSDAFRSMSRFAAEVVSKRIEQLDEVAMVDLSGCVEDEILIIPDIDALRRLSLTESAFEDIVKAADIRLGSLSIRDGEYRYNVKFQSFASSREDIENIYLKVDGRLLQVKDLARVVEHPSERAGLVRSDGYEAVTMAVIKQSDARMADLKKSISSLMDNLSADYPEVEFIITRDQTELLEYSINNLVGNIVAGIILACLVIFLFMKDFRSPALVAFTIPAALVSSMLVFYAIGLTINIISLSGLVLGVGMMVDNTIVLTDNITARWQRGESLRKAVIAGTAEVTGPMLSSVLTTCAVFVPLIFLSGTAGAMFYDQAMAVTVVLLTSYAVTVTVIPVYYWCWYRRQESFRPNALLARFSGSWMTNLYENILVWLFRNRWAGWSVFALSAATIFICFTWMPKEKLPEITYSDTILKIDWNDHISLEENERRTAAVENMAAGAAVQITSLSGIQQFVLGHSGEQGIQESSLYVKCRSAEDLEQFCGKAGAFLDKNYPSCIYRFETSGNIFDMVFGEKDADLVARIRPVSGTGLDPEAVYETVHRLAGMYPDEGIGPVALKTDILYVADPEKMALYDVSYQDLVNVLENAMNSNSLFKIVQGNRTLPVVMGVDTKDLEDIIAEMYISRDGYEIPVGALMKQTSSAGLKSIVAGEEGVYYPVEMNFSGNDPSELISGIREAVAGDGRFEVSFSGSYFSNRKMTGELAMVLFIAVLLLYLILASQFESLLQPLIILSEIVIDIAGALAVLWICGVSINLMSLIGLVVICGIVINDSILKIDTINRLRKEGMTLRHSIMEAGKRRLKAILMTSLTTILSVCPFLARGSMGNDLQYPMSLVIISGMIVGTAISLFFVPMVYFAIYRKGEARR